MSKKYHIPSGDVEWQKSKHMMTLLEKLKKEKNLVILKSAAKKGKT